VRLQLHAFAYNLGNFMRTLAMPKTAQPWSLTSLREKLIKIGAKVVSHGRYATFQMAEVAVSRQMFADILSLIARLEHLPRRHEGRRGQSAAGDRGEAISAYQRPGAHKGLLRSPFAPHWADLPLPKPFRGAILASKPPRRMSVKKATLVQILCSRGKRRHVQIVR
jgi:hypothetical protein